MAMLHLSVPCLRHDKDVTPVPPGHDTVRTTQPSQGEDTDSVP